MLAEKYRQNAAEYVPASIEKHHSITPSFLLSGVGRNCPSLAYSPPTFPLRRRSHTRRVFRPRAAARHMVSHLLLFIVLQDDSSKNTLKVSRREYVDYELSKANLTLQFIQVSVSNGED